MSKTLNSEIDLKELFEILWSKKLEIILITSITALATALLTLFIPNTYKSETLLAPVEISSSPNSAQRTFSQLSPIPFFSLSNTTSDKTLLAIETIKSRKFFKLFLQDFSESDFFTEMQPNFEDGVVRNFEEVHEAFLRKLTIDHNQESNFIVMSYEDYSSDRAKNILENIIQYINFELKQEDIKQAEKSIEFLNQQIQGTELQEVKIVLSQLVQSQIEKIMTASATDEYVFKVIDPAYAPINKYAPDRKFIVLLATFIALLLTSITFVALFHSNKEKSELKSHN